MAEFIKFDRITKFYGPLCVVENLDLSIAKGEFVSLLGPSGSGKTTLLMMLAGFEQATSGKILLDGAAINDVPTHKRDMGVVFQSYALFPHMTVGENIAFGMKVSKIKRSPQAIAARVKELLDLVQLSGLKDRFPGQISGGQRQRVALARALAVDPRVLLLDEPFGALDANVRRDLRRWLRKIHDELGITTLFVTHDQEEALDLADRVVILNKGKIVQEGTPEAVCRSPADAFVMNFLGDANRLDADIRGGKAHVDGIAFEADGIADGSGQILFRPADVTWREDGQGIAASIVRVIDRPDSRRVLAMTRSGQAVEFDTAPEFPHRRGDAGFLDIRRPRVYAAA